MIARVLAALCAGVVAVAMHPACAGEIYLYEKPGPEGQSIKITEATPDLSVVPHNFRIKALMVMNGGWVLCGEKNYDGNCLWLITKFIRNLEHTPFDDDVQSLKTGGMVHIYPWPRDLPAGGVLIAGPVESGEIAPINADTPDLAAAGFDLPVIAVKTGGTHGFAWQLCSEPNFAGRCLLMLDGIDELSAIFTTHIASVRRVPVVWSRAGFDRRY